jgi:excisionase family DNA binding protein
MEELMILAEIVEGKKEALRVTEVARILDVSIKKIYRMAALGQIPSLKISNSIRFDPHEVAMWLRNQSNTNPIPAISSPSRSYSSRRNTRRLNPRNTFDRNAHQPESVHY